VEEENHLAARLKNLTRRGSGTLLIRSIDQHSCLTVSEASVLGIKKKYPLAKVGLRVYEKKSLCGTEKMRWFD
jgi:hypothetical protein